MTPLPRVRADLLSNHLEDQVLIYDRRDDKVHLLDSTTALVFDLIRRGAETRESIIAELASTRGNAAATDLYELAVSELRKAELLDDGTPFADLTRRALIRKLTLAGAAALIPAIITLSPTMAEGQTSCLAKKECCTVDAQCCSNKCDSSTGTGCTTGPLECH